MIKNETYFLNSFSFPEGFHFRIICIHPFTCSLLTLMFLYFAFKVLLAYNMTFTISIGFKLNF